MSKKDEFKKFASTHPELINFINDGSMTWQKFYEIYDIYGDDNRSWSKFINNTSNTENINIPKKLSGVGKILGNIDMNSIQEHINTAQKALGVIQELTLKNSSDVSNVAKGPTSTRPINKFFED